MLISRKNTSDSNTTEAKIPMVVRMATTDDANNSPITIFSNTGRARNVELIFETGRAAAAKATAADPRIIASGDVGRN